MIDIFACKPRSPRSQHGAALAVVLILLLLMTLLGLASLRGTLLEERMGANLLDRSLAFQSAEAALRDAEAVLAAIPPATLPTRAFPAAGCVGGLCATPIPAVGTLDRWLDPAFVGWRNAVVNVGTAAIPPQFFIEDLGKAPNFAGCLRMTPIPPGCESERFRVVARSVAADRAQVILQSNFAVVL